MVRAKSESLFERANRVTPGGVHSPVRAFGAVGGNPVFFQRAIGAHLIDVDGRQYIDLVNSWGAILLGHADPDVASAIVAQTTKGNSFGAPHEGEVKLAEAIVGTVPEIDWVRFVSSGTEAVLAALRLARAATGRDYVLKFSGNYHGSIDQLLVKAGSGVATLGISSSAGVTAAQSAQTLVCPYNDPVQAEALIREYGPACVLVEPIAGNMGFVRPEPEFLEKLRKACDETATLLIFDEVMTGFRAAYPTVATKFGITPDISCFAKVIGGGLPVGAYGGREELKNLVSPLGPMYQAGTLSGNPLAMAAGCATLSKINATNLAQLGERTRNFANEMKATFERHGIPVQIDSEGGMLGLFFTDGPIQRWEDAHRLDHERFRKFFHGMLEQGVYLPPSPYEAWFTSFCFSDDLCNDVLQKIDGVAPSL